MTVRFRLYAVGLVVALLSAGGLVAAPAIQDPAAQAGRTTLDRPIPLDPSITSGRFDNGLRYYIRANNEPEHRAELRLVVNVGSIVEDADQQGLAHFLEHMAFNGTKNFPKAALVDFMESIGMRMGPSVNAFTSFDETVYMLQVPTDRAGVLETSFQILEDWAHNLSLEGEEIDKERGVIVEEWRLRRGAGARMQDKQFPILLQGSQYADRLPIGKTDIIESFPHDRLRKFYQDWYRPDLMAVVAVGDFDSSAVEGLIKKHFGSIPAATSPRPRPAFEVPDHERTLFAIATDPEATSSSVAVYGMMDVRDQTTFASYRQLLVERLFSGMLSSRLSDLTQKPDAPFMFAGAGRGRFVRTKEGATLSALAKDDQIDAALATLLREAERVSRFGFTQTELDRQKTGLVRGLERQVTERRNRPSRQLADEYARHFLQGDPSPGVEFEYEMAGRFVPEIALADVNDLAKTWLPKTNRVLLVSAPERAGLAAPTEARLAAVMAAVGEERIEAFVDTVGDEPLLEPLPEPGTVAKTTTVDPAHQITEWTLSNGVTVVLMPTTFKDDEIVFRGFSPGGTSLASDELFVAARTAAALLRPSLAGLGGFSSTDLRKKLTGKVASVNPAITELEESLSGTASKKDLETLFQLIHLAFVQPRADEQAFLTYTAQQRMMLANQVRSPAFAFSQALASATTQDHPRARPLAPEDVDRMDLQRSLAFYKERFADASDFTFIFVGSLDPAAMKPLAERYLGSLPAIGRKETWRDVGVHAPRGIVERRVEKGLEPQSRAAVVFSGDIEDTQLQRVAIRAMASVLSTRLRDTLREDLGGTYSVGAAAAYERIPRSEFRVTVSFGCAPERNDALVARVFQEIQRLTTDGPTEQETKDAIEALVRDFETNMEQNGYVAAQLWYRYRDRRDVPELFETAAFYRTVTRQDVHDAARRDLDTDNYVKVLLFPEKR